VYAVLCVRRPSPFGDIGSVGVVDPVAVGLRIRPRRSVVVPYLDISGPRSLGQRPRERSRPAGTKRERVQGIRAGPTTGWQGYRKQRDDDISLVDEELARKPGPRSRLGA
jgi:hypothetical protein